MKKYFLAIFALLIFQNLFAFGKKDSSADENQTETAASAEDNNEEKPDEFIKIDLFWILRAKILKITLSGKINLPRTRIISMQFPGLLRFTVLKISGIRYWRTRARP